MNMSFLFQLACQQQETKFSTQLYQRWGLSWLLQMADMLASTNMSTIYNWAVIQIIQRNMHVKDL